MPIAVKPPNNDAISYFVGMTEFICITRYKFIKHTVKHILDLYRKGEANTFLIDGRGKIIIADGYATFYYYDGKKSKVRANVARVSAEIRNWYFTYNKEEKCEKE